MKPSVSYLVTYYYVDDSFWDDGSRVTKGQRTCATPEAVRTLLEKLWKEGGLYDEPEVQRVTHGPLTDSECAKIGKKLLARKA